MSHIELVILNQQYEMSNIELEIFSLGFSVFLLISYLCSLFFRFRLNINICCFLVVYASSIHQFFSTLQEIRGWGGPAREIKFLKGFLVSLHGLTLINNFRLNYWYIFAILQHLVLILHSRVEK